MELRVNINVTSLKQDNTIFYNNKFSLPVFIFRRKVLDFRLRLLLKILQQISDKTEDAQRLQIRQSEDLIYVCNPETINCCNCLVECSYGKYIHYYRVAKYIIEKLSNR